MNFINFPDYYHSSPISQSTTISDLDYEFRLEELSETIEEVANSIEYGLKIDPRSIKRLSNNDIAIIYKNIKPYFEQKSSNGFGQRTRYTDIVVLSGKNDLNSPFSHIPYEVTDYILNLKNELSFMNLSDFQKFLR